MHSRLWARTGLADKTLWDPLQLNANLANVDLSNAEELWEPGSDMWKRGAGLSHADLSGADLSGANLKGANLKGANVTDEQLAECESLQGATMPDGAKHP